MKKKILTFLLALLLIQCTAVQAFAAHPVPDLSATGSISFQMVKNGLNLDGGNLKLCKVGDIQEDDGDYSFALVEELKGNDVDLKTPTDPEVAEKLLKLAKENHLTTRIAPISKGKAVFANLPVGLYLVWQDSADATKGYSAIHPFLISIPKLEGNQYVYDIVAKPKVPIEIKPSPPPSAPPPSPPPYLPQTGQLNWPVPVMAVLGFGLFIFGLLLYSDRKVKDDEA